MFIKATPKKYKSKNKQNNPNSGEKEENKKIRKEQTNEQANKQTNKQTEIMIKKQKTKNIKQKQNRNSWLTINVNVHPPRLRSTAPPKSLPVTRVLEKCG